MNLEERFSKFEDDHGEFEHVEVKQCKRPDIHAFLLLDRLVHGESDIVSCAEHDQIWLGVEPEELNKVISDLQIQELARCGVFYDSHNDSLSMFV